MDIRYHHNRKGILTLSPNARISDSVSLDLTGNITVKGTAEITDDVKIFTHKHNYRGAKRKKDADIIVKDLTIGDDVTIGNNAIIICIASIGDGAVIGAGSIVTKNVPPRQIWAGNPAKRIGER